MTDCNCKKEDTYGKYSAAVNTCLKFSDKFSLRAINWYGPDDKKFTFLESGSGVFGDWIHTKDNVQIQQNKNLDDSLLFTFSKDNCTDDGKNDGYIRYDQKVQLKSVLSPNYVQCSDGSFAIQSTCSRVADSGSCDNTKWQTFVIISAEGKPAGSKICFGDTIRITQTNRNAAGTSNDITAADATQVWGTNTGSNINAIFQILPPSGTIYADVSADQKQYLARVNQNACKQNVFYCPRAWLYSITSFFASLWEKFRIILIIILVSIFFWFLLKLTINIKQLIT